MLATLGDILKSKGTTVKTVTSADSVASAVDEMAGSNIGALPVVDGGRLVGILSERDVLNRIVKNRLDPDTTKVADVMSADPVTGTPGMKVFEALRIMSAKRFRHLPIVEGDRLVSMVSMGDVTARVIADQGESIDSMIRAVKAVRST